LSLENDIGDIDRFLANDDTIFPSFDDDEEIGQF